MKIVTLVRTLNEEQNVSQFIQQYSFSDLIIVSDGGSTDKTILRIRAAARRNNVRVKILHNFSVRIPMADGRYYTNEPVQINLLIRNALKEKADWIIYDDCDCYSNKVLKENARNLFSVVDNEGKEALFVYRLYLCGENEYFPDMNIPGKSLWAWKPSMLSVICNEKDPTEASMTFNKWEVRRYDIEKPYVLLHNFAQTEEYIQKKLEWYKQKKKPQTHPRDGCGKLEVLPNFAKI